MVMFTPSLAQLKKAITISEKIEALEAELQNILGGSATASTGKRKYTKRAVTPDGDAEEASPTKSRKARKPMSPEAREKIAAAQRKRWAKSNKEKKAKAKTEAAKAE
ncbi:MAG: hypothetical protein JWO08_2952 [Verrucomicrobiaceae bacterium]|nr:hypothetical protein [Verrucomicrobiaceae bacterium]